MLEFTHQATTIGTPQLAVVILNYRLRCLLALQINPSMDPSNVEYTENPADPVQTMIIQADTIQTDLGWDKILKGRHSHLWEQMYQTYITTRPPRKYKYQKGTTWASWLVKESVNI